MLIIWNPKNGSSFRRILPQATLFSDVNVSQGIEATRLMFGGIFNDVFVVNVLEGVPVKEFLRSVNI